MIRPVIPVLLAVSLLGCQGQDAKIPMDPFYGPPRIAPPGTGEFTKRSVADPYYPRSAAASTPLGRDGLDPAGDPPSGTLASTPSGRLEAHPSVPIGDRIEIPVSARRQLTSAEMLASRAPSTFPASLSAETIPAAAPPERDREPQRFVQTLVPRARSAIGRSTLHDGPARTRGPTSSRGNPIDINDLPSVDRGAWATRDDRVQQASVIDVGTQLAVRIPTRVDAEDSLGRFGWSDDYTRLRGELEYLERDQRWKLRYIPVDRETDEFGGSVLIEDAASLSGYERGDFVEIRGRIVEKPEDEKTFAPIYDVTSIRRLER